MRHVNNAVIALAMFACVPAAAYVAPNSLRSLHTSRHKGAVPLHTSAVPCRCCRNACAKQYDEDEFDRQIFLGNTAVELVAILAQLVLVALIPFLGLLSGSLAVVLAVGFLLLALESADDW